jgi:hypothetical protein
MDVFRSAVSWSGSDVTMSMFVVSSRSAAPPLDSGELGADQIRTYELEDDDRRLSGRHVYEYDLTWKHFPPHPERVIFDSLVSALRHGAVVAWFGFEGSFDYDYLLHPEIARQLYAVAAGEAVRLALDDDFRAGEDWRQLLAELRSRVLR